MPPELVAKIKKAATFNQGYSLGEVLAAGHLGVVAQQPVGLHHVLQ